MIDADSDSDTVGDEENVAKPEAVGDEEMEEEPDAEDLETLVELALVEAVVHDVSVEETDTDGVPDDVELPLWVTEPEEDAHSDEVAVTEAETVTLGVIDGE